LLVGVAPLLVVGANVVLFFVGADANLELFFVLLISVVLIFVLPCFWLLVVICCFSSWLVLI
jgi:hypothetical protein